MMEFNLEDIIGIVAVFQSALLVIFFLTNKRGDSTGNKIFAALLFTFMLSIGNSLTTTDALFKHFHSYRKILILIGQSAFLIAPLLYFYFKSIITNNFAFSKKDLLHAIPFGIGFVCFSILVYLVKDLHLFGFFYRFIYSGGLLLQQLLYIGIIIRLLKKHNLPLKNLFSKVTDTKLSWLRFFLVGYILIWNMKLQTFLIGNIHLYPGFCPYRESLYFLTMFLFFNTIIFLALTKSDISSGFRKYNGSALSAEEKEIYKAKLTSVLETEKPYLDPELTLTTLSQKISISVRCLSMVINELFNKNFNDFINSYRIQESIRMLTDKSNGKKTMLEIAYSVGFNSKSSFYDAFKKHTGVTPKKYQSNSAK
ncbi:helix-turn-helix domain-containing protein [Bacteroidota bacterium]